MTRFRSSAAPAVTDAAPTVVDSRQRMRWSVVAFVVLLGVVFARLVALEVHSGAAFRDEATRPLERRVFPAGVRGRILARDGTVLAEDRAEQALAIEYRRIEDPPNTDWLRRQARASLPRVERRDPERLAATEARIRVELIDLHRRLAPMCGATESQWDARRAEVQREVSRISRLVNERRREDDAARAQVEADRAREDASRTADSWWRRACRAAARVLTPDEALRESATIVVAEELDFHVLAHDLPDEVVAEIEAHPDRYPGVRIEPHMQRRYPREELAAHLVGHLGIVSPDEIHRSALAAARRPVPGGPAAYYPQDVAGRLGIERRYEPLLRAVRGVSLELTDHAGRAVGLVEEREPVDGRDLVLTLDPALQETAERLLDGALARRPRELSAAGKKKRGQGGGAVVVLDVETGAVLVAASAPRFDPNLFSGANSRQVERLLSDVEHPLFDRAVKMALPPGPIFETVTAAVLASSGLVDTEAPFECQGYWRRLDRQRCSLYDRTGVGHGPVTMVEALAQGCNVYFIHHTAELGPMALVDAALRFGFARPSGIDLPGEAAGHLPTPDALGSDGKHRWHVGDTQALAVGQGSLTATPLQVARLMAAIANGGRLVTPYLARELGPLDSQSPRDDERDSMLMAALQPERARAAAAIGIDRSTLDLLQSTLRDAGATLTRSAGDEQGDVAYRGAAGIGGSAEAGGAREAHAWFAGYAPADAPRVAFAIALEYAGDATDSALPVARRLVERLRQLAYLEPNTRRQRERLAEAVKPSAEPKPR